MNMKGGEFLLSVIVAAAVMTAALGQDLAPAAGAASTSARSNASIPDFSGTWAHPFLNGLEPPLSGPGPVRNRARGRGPQAGASSINQLVGDYANPILQPWAAEVVRKLGESSLAGQAYPTPRNQCWPEQVPFVFINYGMHLLQQPDKITILYPFDHQFRQVRLNQPHPVHVTPSWYGDSVGHYEGSTLVIDTVGVKIGRFSMVDMYGTPHSEALHVVERYQLLDYEVARDGIDRDAKINQGYPPGINPI